MVEKTEGRPLSWGKRVVGLAPIALNTVLVCGVLLWITSSLASKAPPPSGPEGGSAFMMSFVLLVLGVLLFCAGLVGYFLALLTHCFTFDFFRPVFSSFKRRFWVAKLFVPLLLTGGAGLCVSGVLAPTLKAAGVPPAIAIVVPAFGVFLLLDFVLIWFQMWTPLGKRLTTRRLAALGVSPQRMRSGTCVGISDPAKSSFKRIYVENDFGMLWFASDALRYLGDVDEFDMSRDQLVEIERKADAGSVASYGGVVHVILRFQQPDGLERRVRLHPGGSWTLTGEAKLMDRLADRITAWQANTTAPS